jgi:ATP-dependent DNA helicase RecG
VIVARVNECDPSAKPCRVTAISTAYLRGYDGDFPLSELEIQGFLAVRQPPLSDRRPVDGGQPTVAGLLALGLHPQQFSPRYVIQAAAEPLPQHPPALRARNQITITGPIPRMLDTALDWARRTFDTNIVGNPDGSVADQPAYPLIAFREIIANALIHRDLDDWSQAFAIEVRLLSPVSEN